MRSLKCKVNRKAKNSDDCYNCFLDTKRAASRVLCVKENAEYTSGSSQAEHQAPFIEEKKLPAGITAAPKGKAPEPLESSSPKRKNRGRPKKKTR